MIRRTRTALVLVASMASLLVAGAPCAAGGAQSGRVDDGGISVRWEYRDASDAPEDRGLGELNLRIDDAATGDPLRYSSRQLAAWLQLGRQALSDAELPCRDKVRALASQGIGRRAEIDLNGWRLLTFNVDRSIAFINPSVGLNNAKLESIVTVQGDIDAWAHDPSHLRVWVHASDGPRGSLSAIDTQRRRVARRLDVAAGASTLIVDEDLAHVWIAGIEAARLTLVDSVADGAAPSSVEVPGLKGAIAAPGNGVFTWNAGESSLRQWRAAGDSEPLRSTRTWSLPGAPAVARWSNQTQRIVVALTDGRLAWIDPKASRDTPERIVGIGGAGGAETGARLDAMELFDNGRYALWLDAARGRAGAVDLASGRALASAAVVDAADGIVFTEGFAYVNSSRNAAATLLSLSDLRNGRAQPVQVSLGRPSGNAVAGRTVVPDPGGHGVLVASPIDGVVYQYGEGMMAPIGNFSNYRRSALGVLVMDTSLTEVSPGRYRAMIRNERGGVHELVLSGVGPRMAVCATVNLPAPADSLAAPLAAPRLKATLERIESDAVNVALSSRVTVRLSEGDRVDAPHAASASERVEENRSRPGAQVTGVTDLMLLVFDRRSGWQDRVRLVETTPGIYAATVPLPHAGRYDWLVSSASQQMPFGQGRLGQHDAQAR